MAKPLNLPTAERIDGGMIRLTMRTYSEDFPEVKLPSRIAFYRGMVAKFGHRTENYRRTLDALKGVYENG